MARKVSEADALDATKDAFKLLEPLDDVQRRRALGWLNGALGAGAPGSQFSAMPSDTSSRDASSGTDASELGTPKQFMAAKSPTTSAERLACLAFYRARTRNETTFKTKDLENLNTEAAGVKFGNIRRDIDNATYSSNFFTSAGKSGTKQLTTLGERIVEALPDRERVKKVRASTPVRKRRPSKPSKKGVKKRGRK
jgi:hypothetical protein